MFAPNSKSFLLVRNKARNSNHSNVVSDFVTSLENNTNQSDSTTSEVRDAGKRMFLTVLTGAGLGAVALAAFPKSASALVVGSSPTTGVVGMKDASNARINPAKEDGNLATIAGKDFATQTTLATVAAKDFATQTTLATLTAKDFATETTLSGIKTTSDKFQFDVSNNLKVVTTGGSAGASNVGILNTVEARVNPATEDSVIYLRRIVKLMESQAVVDAASRQKVNVDSFGTNTTLLTGVGTGAGTPRITIASDSAMALVASAAVIGSLTNVATIAGQNQQMYQDVARNAFANSIRSKLTFS